MKRKTNAALSARAKTAPNTHAKTRAKPAKTEVDEKTQRLSNDLARARAETVRKSRTHKSWRVPSSSGGDEDLLESFDFSHEPGGAWANVNPEDSKMANISFGFENPLKSRFGESFFKELPKDPGVYTFLNSAGQPLYIGKANNLKARLMSYQAAKPGQAPDHILEMIEHAHEVKFELRENEKDALRREEELIRAVRPPYNVALNYDVSYLYIAYKADRRSSRVEFRLSHYEVESGFKTFGCFRHRGKAKAAYSALMRLLFAAFCPRDRFQLPSKICRSSPAYQYATDVDADTLEHIDNYLAGRNNDLLKHLVDTMLTRENFPKQLYIPMQRDIDVLKEFYVYGPVDTTQLAKRLRCKSGIVPQHKMDSLVASDYSKSLAKL